MSKHPMYVKQGREQPAATPAREVQLRHAGWTKKPRPEPRPRPKRAEPADPEPAAPTVE